MTTTTDHHENFRGHENGDWDLYCPANDGFTFTADGVTWRLNGHEHGSNRTGEHFLTAVSRVGVRDFALRDFYAAAGREDGVRVWRASFEVTKRAAMKNARRIMGVA